MVCCGHLVECTDSTFDTLVDGGVDKARCKVTSDDELSPILYLSDEDINADAKQAAWTSASNGNTHSSQHHCISHMYTQSVM